MALSTLLDFLKAATGFIQPEGAAIDQTGENASVATRYHRRIVVIAGSCGLIGAIGGVVGAFLSPPVRDNELKLILMAPFLAGIVGILEGVALSCLFAPSAFLSGPVGQKWMSLIGTKSVTGARITCALLALAPVCVPAGLALYAAWRKG